MSSIEVLMWQSATLLSNCPGAMGGAFTAPDRDDMSATEGVIGEAATEGTSAVA